MNPTDEVDDLLTRAGARWRADQPSAPEPDLDHILGGRRRPRRWVPALAAASVAAIAAAALTVLPDGGQDPAAVPPATSDTQQSFAQGNQQTPMAGVTQPDPVNDKLLVGAGDKVQASGEVIAVPGQEPVFCPSHPTDLIGYPPGQEPAPSCPANIAVKLKGVDLDRLGDAKTIKNVRRGTATLIGIWGNRSIDVQEQKAYVVPPATQIPPLPCKAPQGGWVSKPNNLNAPAVLAFLDAHSAQIAEPLVQYPDGHGRGKPIVVQVGVAHGDLAVFRSSLDKVFDGNLCISRALLSRGDVNRIYQTLTNLTAGQELGIQMTSASTPGGGRAEVEVVVYTEAVKAALTPVGLNLLTVKPAVQPIA
ncbi:hypothetical protein E0H73_20885 [Kribbella pittospori]|uniref:Uncharacterized protein n=1 Tax=Kribbella pittospori TaxID=722689 RepID=A0A4V2MAT5_9ACTN|nr:hypothetical protein [Kribbella pittospori]TCC60392.1 hypothetical protein E0H73_20885 [Kribbella pittospori]